MSSWLKPWKWSRHYDYGTQRTTRKHIKRLQERQDNIESLLFELIKELDYVATISDADADYFTLKKVKESK